MHSAEMPEVSNICHILKHWVLKLTVNLLEALEHRSPQSCLCYDLRPDPEVFEGT